MKTSVAFFLFIASISYAQLAPQNLIIPDKFKDALGVPRSVSIDGQYEISVFYAGEPLFRAGFMAYDAKQVLHVADMKTGFIFALPDKNHDGIADTAIAVTPHVDTVHSLAFYKNTLYIAEPTRIRRFQDTDADGSYETEITPFYTNIPSTGPYNHFTRTILIDSIKKYLYVSVGASCNACREEREERGAILRFDLEGKSGAGKKVYASGLRNAIGLSLHPNGTLWATNADRDGLGDGIPPEIITEVKEDGYYGWPFAYGEKTWVDLNAADEYKAILPITHADTLKVASMQVGDIFIPPHSTPMGILFYNDPRVYIQAPPTTAFVAIHGSSGAGRSVGVGYNVIKTEYNDIQKQWSVSTFLEGFLTDSVHYGYWSRPCGIIQDSSGYDMFLSSDMGVAAIYRITLKDHSSTPTTPTFPMLNAYLSTNPTHGRTSLSLDGIYATSVTVSFYDATGKEIHVPMSRSVVADNSVTYDLDFSAEATSVYFCVVRSAAGMKMLPIHVIH